MTITKTIPAERLIGLDVQPGDTLRVVAATDAGILIQISRDDAVREPATGAVGAWVSSAKGSVHLPAGESVDDARMDYYAKKYGLAE